eukprot:GHVU01084393.1.p1 GENE.GHVU01084393.1~~GHVU01084393.1.p1  ORF type:complete len:265 (+),score=36.06 GHVU01084393.1:1526-2320(+)
MLPRQRSISYLMRPAAGVVSYMNVVQNHMWGHPTPTVALVIRTGKHETQNFLRDGDEFQFFYCFRQWVAMMRRKQVEEKVNSRYDFTKGVNVILVSDCPVAKRRVRKALEGLKGEGEQINVVGFSKSVIHVISNTEVHENTTASTNVTGRKRKLLSEDEKTRLVKTFAEFHLIQVADFAFLTQQSLFGFIAAEVGGIPAEQTFLISASDCADPNRGGYVHCASPPQPPFCDPVTIGDVRTSSRGTSVGGPAAAARIAPAASSAA